MHRGLPGRRARPDRTVGGAALDHRLDLQLLRRQPGLLGPLPALGARRAGPRPRPVARAGAQAAGLAPERPAQPPCRQQLLALHRRAAAAAVPAHRRRRPEDPQDRPAHGGKAPEHPCAAPARNEGRRPPHPFALAVRLLAELPQPVPAADRRPRLVQTFPAAHQHHRAGISLTPDLRDTLDALLLHARHARDAGDAALARRCFEQARQIAPDDPDVTVDLAAACLSCGDWPDALRHADATLRHGPDWRASLVAAQALKHQGRSDDHADRLATVLATPRLPAPVEAAALAELADLELNAFGDARAAAASLQRAVRARPSLEPEAQLAGLVADLYDGQRERLDIAIGFMGLHHGLQAPAAPPARPPRPPGARPRVGLVSSQFCASPVGFLTLGALTELSRHADLLFFDRGAKADWAQSAFRGIAHRWLACPGVDAPTLHRLMVAADLDTLIDLGGWTDPTALAAVAGHPARRQLKWVGGQSLTTGLPCFDGFITDRRQTPVNAGRLYTEPLLLARHGYVTYTAPPYAPELAAAAADPPPPAGRPALGVLALVSNPAKISPATAAVLQKMKPRRLLLIDQRWRHQATRDAAHRRLGSLMDVAEFITPAHHPEYLQALRDTDAAFVDTTPYSMGLTAIELRLLGKHVVTQRRPTDGLMCERHCTAHMGADRFDHHASLGGQLLEWCRG
ncbi:tetratricopeptide repeat protein [Xylophilus sp. Kf1]|nr:tetratricopeptide repeat protein [Xylophilus sp. Kf1]